LTANVKLQLSNASVTRAVYRHRDKRRPLKVFF
jgi:hypothetical protein